MNREEVQRVVKDVHAPGWFFDVYDTGNADDPYLYAVWVRLGYIDGQPDYYETGKYPGGVPLTADFPVPDHWDAMRIVEQCFVERQFLLDHEGRESFTWNRKQVFSPHAGTGGLSNAHKRFFVDRHQALMVELCEDCDGGGVRTIRSADGSVRSYTFCTPCDGKGYLR